MLRKVGLDYLDSIKIKPDKEQFTFSKVWVYFYMLILLPCMMLSNGSGIRFDSYYLMVIPMLFGLYSMSVVPIQLPKQMYLCPMEKEERRTYAGMLYALRLIVPILIGILFHGIGAALGVTSVEEAALQEFALISMMLCISISTYPGARMGDKQEELYHLYTKRMRGLNNSGIFGLLVAMVLKVLLIYNGKWHWEYKGWFQIYVVCSVIAMVVFDMVVLSYLKPMLDQLIIYDLSYEVWKRQQN